MSPDNWAVRPAPDGMRVTPATAITQTGGGFDWVDAAIGTMATLGVLLASAGARAYIRRRHALAA